MKPKIIWGRCPRNNYFQNHAIAQINLTRHSCVKDLTNIMSAPILALLCIWRQRCENAIPEIIKDAEMCCTIFFRCEKHEGEANSRTWYLILTTFPNIYTLSPFPPSWVNIRLSWWWESRVLTKFGRRVNIVASRRLCDDSTCAHNQRQITSKLKQVCGTVDLYSSRHVLPLIL